MAATMTSRPPEFPYPGDGYDADAWRAYDLTFAIIYGGIGLLALLLLSRILRQIRRERAAGRAGAVMGLKRLRRTFYTCVLGTAVRTWLRGPWRRR